MRYCLIRILVFPILRILATMKNGMASDYGWRVAVNILNKQHGQVIKG